MSVPDFLPGVAADHVLARLAKAGGDEIESGKLASPESSAALAVNCFGWFIERPALLPAFPGMMSWSEPKSVDVEYQARFPWSGGRHPWLDAVVVSDTQLIGVESKRFEPFRDKKSVSLSAAYNRPVWGEAMQPFERLRDSLRSGEVRYRYLDAVQLVKHAFGLVKDGRRLGKIPALVYLFAEPSMRGKAVIDSTAFAAHRMEIGDFSQRAAGAEVRFHAVSYREWIATWPQPDAKVVSHGRSLLETFSP